MGDGDQTDGHAGGPDRANQHVLTLTAAMRHEADQKGCDDGRDGSAAKRIEPGPLCNAHPAERCMGDSACEKCEPARDHDCTDDAPRHRGDQRRKGDDAQEFVLEKGSGKAHWAPVRR